MPLQKKVEEDCKEHQGKAYSFIRIANKKQCNKNAGDHGAYNLNYRNKAKLFPVELIVLLQFINKVTLHRFQTLEQQN